MNERDDVTAGFSEVATAGRRRASKKQRAIEENCINRRKD
jgi:hypothetical protein